ncbi:MAG: hypothetical protein RQ824_03335 [bacterium]|nr:hypothetical protein [bacterium]
MKENIKLPINATRVIPHRKAMCLIEELSEYGSGHVKGTASIAENNPFLNDMGFMDNNALVECMAQVVAAGNGYYSRIMGEPVKTGFLVGINNFEFIKAAKKGDALTIHINPESKIGDFSIVEGSIKRGKECLARGGLKFFELPGMPHISASLPADVLIETDEAYKTLTKTNGSAISKGLIDSLTSIEVNEKENITTCSFYLDKNFIGFEGHFPDLPILPGVIMVDMARILTEAMISCQVKISYIDKAKFTKQIYPPSSMQGEVKIKRETDHIGVTAILRNGGEKAATIFLRAIKAD